MAQGKERQRNCTRSEVLGDGAGGGCSEGSFDTLIVVPSGVARARILRELGEARRSYFLPEAGRWSCYRICHEEMKRIAPIRRWYRMRDRESMEDHNRR